MFWQWFSNGVPISIASPATQGNLVTTGRGTYTVIASNALGASAISPPMTISDGPSAVFTLSVSQGIQGNGNYAVGTTNIPIAVTAFYANADYPVFDHWNTPWMAGVIGVTCTVANPLSPQTVAVFSGNLTNLTGKAIGLVPTYRTSKAWLTVVSGLGSGHYDINVVTNADITALPAPPGYRFDRWESSAGIQAPLSPTTKITLASGQTLVNALYTSVQPMILDVSRSGVDVVVQWSAASGANYTLQTSPVIGNGAVWSDVPTTNRPAPVAPPWSLTVTNPAAASVPLQFYRVRASQ